MRRVIVLGGLGLFGRTIAEQLQHLGVSVRTASRRAGADIQIDANGCDSIRAALRADDVVVDAAGPYHERSPALIEAAIEIGFDVIDINDNLRYAESVVGPEARIVAAGIRVLSSASSVSAVAAAVVAQSKIVAPERVTAFLAPASRHTANAGTALSLLQSVGQPVRLLRNGRLQAGIGWSESQRFPMPRPIGTVRGRLFESADSLYLPRIWPTLREAAMYVDTNIPGMNSLLRLAAKSDAIRAVLRRGVHLGTAVARRLGAPVGGIGYEIEDITGQVARYAICANRNSYLTAVAPAVLTARSIAEDRFAATGLIMPDRQVDPAGLFAFLRDAGIVMCEVD